MGETISFLIGSSEHSLLWWQMCVRAVVIFIYALFLVRVGATRVFGKSTGFDIVLAVILGSILSRAVTGNAELFPVLAASTLLMAVHLVLSKLALRSKRLGHLIKGTEIKVVENGTMLPAAMKKAGVTEHDIREAMRCKGDRDDIRIVEAAYLERNGKLSVLKK